MSAVAARQSGFEALLDRARRFLAAAPTTPLLAAATTLAVLSNHFLGKVAFGTGAALGEPPSKLAVLGLARALSAGVYALAARREPQTEVLSAKAWAVCLPCAAGMLGCLLLSLQSLEFLSLPARNAIVQGRLLLDLLVGGALLGAEVTPRKVAGASMVLLCSAGSILTATQSAASTAPMWGVAIALALNGLSSCTLALQQLVLRETSLSQAACSLVCALEGFVLCLGLDGGFSLTALRPVDWLLVLAMSATDVCYLLVPVFMPGIAPTLCLAATLPLGYLAEAAYFALPHSFSQFAAAASAGLASSCYALDGHRAAVAAQLAADELAAEEQRRPVEEQEHVDYPVVEAEQKKAV